MAEAVYNSTINHLYQPSPLRILIPHPPEQSILDLHQITRIAEFYRCPVIQHQNTIKISDRAETVRNDKES
ncbi:hypothetical protein N7516_007580 [Penicillium verrucosum]|uniref:uncharacterized protein n=1 Tax=Penicillium verrucosum TaxID=60171 RepID=UPI002544EEAF|nr:uncharacterized protein N7516_007580 [Penicillium verrucosum]KAJ5933091.1 hypothetical protein N7516_007580 [Penicillium verrucosum]